MCRNQVCVHVWIDCGFNKIAVVFTLPWFWWSSKEYFFAKIIVAHRDFDNHSNLMLFLPKLNPNIQWIICADRSMSFVLYVQVLHPKNPFAPTLHFNYRYFETDAPKGMCSAFSFFYASIVPCSFKVTFLIVTILGKTTLNWILTSHYT